MIGYGYIVLRNDVEPEREQLTEEDIEWQEKIEELRIQRMLQDERDQITY